MNAITDDILMSYLDGELQPHERRTVEAALAADSGVREQLAFLQRMERSAAATITKKAPAGMARAVMAEVQAHAGLRVQENPHKSNRALYLFLGLIAAFIGIAIFLPDKENTGGESVLMPTMDWFSRLFETLSTHMPEPGALFRGFTLYAPDTMMLGIAAMLLLALLDIYVLRPLSRRNGH